MEDRLCRCEQRARVSFCGNRLHGSVNHVAAWMPKRHDAALSPHRMKGIGVQGRHPLSVSFQITSAMSWGPPAHSRWAGCETPCHSARRASGVQRRERHGERLTCRSHGFCPLTAAASASCLMQTSMAPPKHGRHPVLPAATRVAFICLGSKNETALAVGRCLASGIPF